MVKPEIERTIGTPKAIEPVAGTNLRSTDMNWPAAWRMFYKPADLWRSPAGKV